MNALPSGVAAPYEVMFFPNGTAAVGDRFGRQIGFFQIGKHGDTVAALKLFGFKWWELRVFGSPQEYCRFTQDQLEALLLFGWKVDPCHWERPDEIVWIEPDMTEHGEIGNWREYPLPWPSSAAEALKKYRK